MGIDKTPALQEELDRIYAVQFDHVTKDFGSVLGLDDVTVGFRAGEVSILLGLSGSGKSTLLRHINGLQHPSSGVIRALGRDVTGMQDKQLRGLRQDIGMIFQDFNLVGPMSVLENVCTGALGKLRGPRMTLMMYPKAIRREALEQLDRVGLVDRAYQRADTLSGGQQQRVAIARCLMQHPKVLLADEPVASLDPISSQAVMELLREITREENLTVITSLHQVPIALAMGDRIIGLRGGKMIFDRDTDDLDEPTINQIYGPIAVASPEDEATTRADAAEVTPS